MAQINRTTDEITTVIESIEKTRDRFDREGFDHDNEAMEILEEFCRWLLDGSSRTNPQTVNSFLTGQDMEI